MTPPDELSYDRAAERIGRLVAAIGSLGTAVSFAAGGWKWGAGFFLGALFSTLNYQWLRRLVEALGGQKRPRRRRSIVIALRYLLLGGAVYVIVRFSTISVPAVFAGVFVLTAAIFIEVAIEIVYARK